MSYREKIADPEVASSIPAGSHIFVEIGHETFSMAILLFSSLMLAQERLLSVASESMCIKYWLTA